jgi:hypothetical protein
LATRGAHGTNGSGAFRGQLALELRCALLQLMDGLLLARQLGLALLHGLPHAKQLRVQLNQLCLGNVEIALCVSKEKKNGKRFMG